MGTKGQPSNQDPSFSPRSRKKESRGAIVGVTGQTAQIYVHVGPRAQSEDSK